MSWRGAVTPDYPEFDTENEQEAVRFLVSDIDAKQVIRGIDDRDRLIAWIEVAKELDTDGPERRALRQRLKTLEESDAPDFQAASRIEPEEDVGGGKP